MKTFDLKQGPLIKHLTEEQFKYQLQYPQGSITSCIEHLRIFKDSL
jgi:hypothetical protein